MAEALGELEIRIRGKLDDLDRDFSTAKSKALGHVDDIAEQSKAKIGGAFKAIGGVGTLIAGAFAGVAAGKFLGGAMAELSEAQKTASQTAAVIKSTGGAANVSAKQVDSLSNSLSNMSGIDDEAIAAGENMLLTFTNIQNRAGKGNDIFNQATKATLDMSVAMGTDMKQSAIQVGKALNDPIKGVTALQRVGVTFTAAQKDQIAQMVKVGDVAGAQKIILAELNKEFGGSAAAQATSAQKMSVAWKNLEESAGYAIAPIVGGLANLGSKVLPKVADGIGKFSSQFGEAFSAQRKFGEWQAHGFPEMVGVGAAKAIGAIKQIGSVLLKRDFVGGGPFEEDSPLIKGVFRFRDTIAAAVEVVQRNWPKISQVISEVASTIAQVVGGVVTVITVIWTNFGSQIVTVVKAAWGIVGGVIEGALQIIRGVVQVVTSLIQGDWSGVWNGIVNILSGAWTAIEAIITGALEIVGALLSAGWEIIKGVFFGVVHWFGDRVDDVVGFFTSLPGRIADAVVGMWDGLVDAFRSAINWIIDIWNGLHFTLPEINFGLFHLGGETIRTPHIDHLAGGGIVPATAGGRLALLGEGGRDEAVIPLPSGYSSPSDRLGSMGGGDGGGQVLQVFHIKGSVLFEREVQAISRRALEKVGRHNVDSGVKVRR